MNEPGQAPSGIELYLTEIRVVDWPKVLFWYTKRLGLPLLLRDEPGGFALLGTASGRLALKRSTSPDAAIAHPRLVFRVVDLDAEPRPTSRSWDGRRPSQADNRRESYREVRLTDPEGTPIMLFAWSEDGSLPSG